MRSIYRNILSFLLIMGMVFIPAGQNVQRDRQPGSASATSTSTLYVEPNGACGGYTPCYTHPQLAVDAALEGDTILITGDYSQTYNRSGHTQVIYIDKSLTLSGGCDENFVQQASGMNPVGIQPPAGSYGIYIEGGTLTGVVLNSFYFYGADGPSGAAIYSTSSSLSISGSTFMNNKAPSCASLSVDGGVLVIENTIFHNNEAENDTAGICASSTLSGSSIHKVRFTGNRANANTSIKLVDSTIDISRTLFQENSALNGTTAVIYTDHGNHHLTNNLFLRNYAAGGATILNAINTSTVNMQHNTVNGDYYLDELIRIWSSSSVSFYYNILTNSNYAFSASGGTLSAAHNIFFNITENVNDNSGNTISITNTYTDDPGFASTSSYLIDPTSPAEGKASGSTTAIDYESAYRPLGTGADLGAIEAPLPMDVDTGSDTSAIFSDPTGLATTVFVPAGATPANLTLFFTPRQEPGEGFTDTIQYAGRAFEFTPSFSYDLQYIFLPAIMHGAGLARSGSAPVRPPVQPLSYAFDLPVTFTIEYQEEDLGGQAEDDLHLYYYDEDLDQWLDAAGTCSPLSAYTYEPEADRFSVRVCHLSRFGIGGK